MFTLSNAKGNVFSNREYKIRIINKDYKEYYNIAGDNEGGTVIETDSLKPSDIVSLRGDLLKFLKRRGQRGKLQDYYSRLKQQ